MGIANRRKESVLNKLYDFTGYGIDLVSGHQSFKTLIDRGIFNDSKERDGKYFLYISNTNGESLEVNKTIFNHFNETFSVIDLNTSKEPEIKLYSYLPTNDKEWSKEFLEAIRQDDELKTLEFYQTDLETFFKSFMQFEDEKILSDFWGDDFKLVFDYAGKKEENLFWESLRETIKKHCLSQG